MFFKHLLKTKCLIYQECKRNSSRNVLSLRDRGMWNDLFPDKSTREVLDLLNGSPQSVYAGFDPTANSLHVGNLLVLVNLIHWQRGGHQPIALIGGATAKIGDPSGKTTERDQLAISYIEENIVGIRKNIETIFENHEKYLWTNKDSKLSPLRIVNNNDWYSKISAVDLICTTGRKLRMGTLLSRTSVQTRLNSHNGMSLTEFSYQLFQAYDWLRLFEDYNCNFQIGGADQMGNIMSGHELISKTFKKPVYGLTLPLITTEMGDKFGKSAGNAIWLSSKLTSTFTLYQFFMRMSDVDAEKMLKLFTFDSLRYIEDLMKKHYAKPELHLAQKRLAEQVTLLVHGEAGLKQAQAATEGLYEGNVRAISNLTADEAISIFEGATVINILPDIGQSMLDVAMRVGCFPTKNDAARIMNAGGFYINQQRATNPQEVLDLGNTAHRLENGLTLLRVGKKNYYIVKWL